MSTERPKASKLRIVTENPSDRSVSFNDYDVNRWWIRRDNETAVKATDDDMLALADFIQERLSRSPLALRPDESHASPPDGPNANVGRLGAEAAEAPAPFTGPFGIISDPERDNGDETPDDALDDDDEGGNEHPTPDKEGLRRVVRVGPPPNLRFQWLPPRFDQKVLAEAADRAAENLKASMERWTPANTAPLHQGATPPSRPGQKPRPLHYAPYPGRSTGDTLATALADAGVTAGEEDEAAGSAEAEKPSVGASWGSVPGPAGVPVPEALWKLAETPPASSEQYKAWLAEVAAARAAGRQKAVGDFDITRARSGQSPIKAATSLPAFYRTRMQREAAGNRRARALRQAREALGEDARDVSPSDLIELAEYIVTGDAPVSADGGGEA